MGYSLSVNLKDDAPIDYLESVLKNSEFLKMNTSITVSQYPENHGYSVPYEKGLYISFRSLDLPESYFIHGVFKLAAVMFGITTENPHDKIHYPFYNYDREISLIIPESEYIENKSLYKEFSTYKGSVVSSDYVEDIYEEVEAKADAAREKGLEYEDDMTMYIQYYSFDYIKSTPEEKEFSIQNFLINLITKENKLLKEIFDNLKEIEIELQKKKTL